SGAAPPAPVDSANRPGARHLRRALSAPHTEQQMTEPLDALSKNESIKARSQHLRGTIKEELREDTPAFTEEAAQVLKFHGVYQQDDRDRRKEARALGLDKAHQMMIRTRIPGGVVSPDGYLAHDDIATRWGNGTLR